MSKLNLRAFIEEANKLGEIKQVKKHVSPKFEVSVAELTVRCGEESYL